MKLALWITCALLMLLTGTVLSAVAVPFGDSQCVIQNSAGENFAGFVHMLFAGSLTFLIGGPITVLIVRSAWRRNLATLRALSNVAVVILAFPLLSFSFSFAYNYKSCRSLTPEQIEVMRHG